MAHTTDFPPSFSANEDTMVVYLARDVADLGVACDPLAWKKRDCSSSNLCSPISQA